MDGLKENFAEMEIGDSAESLKKMVEAQRELFHLQINQLQNVVVKQCHLTGVNPLAQEMAAGALSIKIGKRPRDLLNPKAIKYMQAVFAIKDEISKKESREISALFGVKVTQVREFFASQRTRVRKQVRLSREKAIQTNDCKKVDDDVSAAPDSVAPVEPVPLSSIGPITAEESLSCSSQDDTLTSIDELDKHFVDNIFSMMQKEETFSGQEKLMEWALKIQNSSVLYWFLRKGGIMILATWLSQAAAEEQTTILLAVLKVLCHLPLHKALPEHMSIVLQSVNRLRFYRAAGISNRARLLLSKWSKIFARSQALKKPNGMKSSTEAQNEMLLKQSISEIMGDESWQADVENSGATIVPLNDRKMESPQAPKLLPAPTDDSSRKQILGVSASNAKKRRKVQLVEQPGQKMAGKSSQTTRAVPVSQSRPMSADDIQKAKMRALYMQSKSAKSSSIVNGINEAKAGGMSKPFASQASFLPPVSKISGQSKSEEQIKPTIAPPKTSERLEAPFHQQKVDSRDLPLEKCRVVQIPWQTPPEMRLNDLWRVGAGENSKEVDVQKNRNRREKETMYHTTQEIPLNLKEPWDREMDYDDTLTPEIPTEQPPDTDGAETLTPHSEHVKDAGASSSQMTSAAEPDLELLAVLLKNPDLVFALKAGNLTSEETVKLLDMIKAGGAGVAGTLNGSGKTAEEKIEVSLPSPTPSSNPGTSGWRPEAVRNPFSQQSSVGHRAGLTHGVATASPSVNRLPGFAASHVPVTDVSVSPQQANGPSLAQQLVAAMAQLLPQSHTITSEQRQPSVVPSLHRGLPANAHIIQTPHSEIAPTMRNLPIAHANAPLPNLSAAAGPSMRVETLSSVNPAMISMAPNVQEKLHSTFSLRSLQPQPSVASASPLVRHSYAVRTPQGNVGPVSDPWRARQNLASNPHLQANQSNYSASSFGGPVQPQARSGPPWEGNEYVGNRGFESWSPDNSPTRPTEYVPGRNIPEPRPDRSWQQSSSMYKDHNRQGNRRWNERRR